MTIGEWLAARSGGAPDSLLARVRDGLHAAALERPFENAYDVFMAGAERLLVRVRQSDPQARATALDLLAADALVTFAFEAASEDPARLAGRADAAMRALAAR